MYSIFFFFTEEDAEPKLTSTSSSSQSLWAGTDRDYTYDEVSFDFITPTKLKKVYLFDLSGHLSIV